jgi:lipopolysaccharide export system protein LptC
VSEGHLAPPVVERRVRRTPWHVRALGVLSAYLPMFVMALLALGSWWLVDNTPVPAGPRAAAAPRHEPDYTMRDFLVQRYAADGALRTQIEGDVAVHYPDTDTLEIENPRIRAVSPNGEVTRASARRALANGDGSEVQLLDDAHVVREATPQHEAIDFRSDFLQIFRYTERVRTHLPVRVRQGGTEVQAAGMEYDHLTRIVQLAGRMQGVFPSRPALPGR